MKRVPVKSSNIKDVGYDEKTKTLEVEFLHGGVYQYSPVPKEKHDAMIKADSVGAYFAANIKSNNAYQWKKVQAASA